MVLFFADLSFIFARSILMRVWELWVSINSSVSPVLTSKIQSNAMTMSIKFQKQTNSELYKTLMDEWIEFSWEFCEISKKHIFLQNTFGGYFWNHHWWKPFLIKLHAVFLQSYSENSVTDDFGEFFRIATFQTSGRLLSFPQESLLCLCYPCSVCFKDTLKALFW